MVRVIKQKLPLSENKSFVARTYSTPNFETSLHQHEEIELLLIKEGRGTAIVGNYTGRFEEGDVFLLGKDLPHWFKKDNEEMHCSSVIIHVNPNFWGKELQYLPEFIEMNKLLKYSSIGLKIVGETRDELQPKIIEIEKSNGLTSFVTLLSCFSAIMETKNYEKLSVTGPPVYSLKDIADIDKIVEYTLTNYNRPISIKEVADKFCMSVSTFCRFFKKSTKKNFSNFLKEVRINNACKLLIITNQSIQSIYLETGYNNYTNFYKQFNELKHVTPIEYRNMHSVVQKYRA